MEMTANNKRYKVVIIVLVLVIVILSSLLMYLVTFDLKKGNDTNKVRNNTSIITEVIDEHAIQKLADVIRFSYNIDLVEGLPYGNTKDFEDWQKIALTIMSTDRSWFFNNGQSNDGFINYDTLKMQAEYLFGKKVVYKDDNYNEFKDLYYDGFFRFDYNINTKTYNIIGLYGIVDYFNIKNEPLSFSYVPYKLEKNGNEYYLYVYKAYSEYVTNDNQQAMTKYYKDKNKQELLYERKANKQYTFAETRNQFVEAAKEKDFPKVKYTFQKEDVNYIWTKYELLK